MATGIGGLYGDNMKFFREGLDCPHVSILINKIEMEFTPPAFNLGAELGEYRIPVRYSADERQTEEKGQNEIEGIARYNIITWAGSSAETIIYHHGSGETNYTARIKQIALKAKDWPEKNIIAVSIPFNSNMKEYLYGVGSLKRFAFIFASSVRLTEHIVRFLKQQGNRNIVCAGMSLGGWITNLHHTYHNSCTTYKPIFAGAAPDHLFLHTPYRKMVACQQKKIPDYGASDTGDSITAALNFEEDFLKRENGNVFPCMARFDQYINLERQSGIYREENMRIIEKGHITGAAAYKELRQHLQ